MAEAEAQRMVGWAICRIKDDIDDIGALKSKNASFGSKIKDLTYGTISSSHFPPSNLWVFLAKGMIIRHYSYD
jgi:hypothetical protein